MLRASRFIFLLVGGGVALLVLVVLAALVLPRVLDMDSYRRQLEARVSAVSGMQVAIGGRMTVALLPALQLELNDVRISRDGKDIATAASLRVGIAWLPLLRKAIEIDSLVLQDSAIFIERYQDRTFNVSRTGLANEDDMTAWRVAKIVVANGTFQYKSAISGSEYAASACNIDVDDVLFAGGSRDDNVLGKLSLAAELACGEVRRNEITVHDLVSTVKGSKGVFNLAPLTTQAFGTEGSGKLDADFSVAIPKYDLDYALPRLHIEDFFETMAPRQTVAGTLDFSTTLAMQGHTLDEVRQSMAGRISLQGEQLTLHGIDLDEQLERFESTRSFNLVDLGAVFFAGPLGLVVTKGYEFANLFQDADTSSAIETLISDWRVENGVAQAQDVALATAENRLALKGGVDFHNKRFTDMTVALLDARGCARMEQVIQGSFQDPEIGRLGILETLVAPAISLVEQGLELLPGDGEECEPFYAGSLPAQ